MNEMDEYHEYDYVQKKSAIRAIKHMIFVPRCYRDEFAMKIRLLRAADAREERYSFWTLSRDANGEPVLVCDDCTTPRSGAGRYCSYCGAKMEDKNA